MVGGACLHGLELARGFRCLEARRLVGRGGRCSLDRRAGHTARGNRALKTRGLEEVWVVLGRGFRARDLVTRALGRCGVCRGGSW